MTLDDAITHHAWASMACEGQVSEEHRQQAEWLMELKQLREESTACRSVIAALLQCVGEIKRDVGCDACPMYKDNRVAWCNLRPTLRGLGFEVVE